MKITDLISTASIDLNVKAKNKEELIEKAVKLMTKNGNIKDEQKYLELVTQREKQSSTGIGEEIAIPHGKGECITAPGVSAMVIPEGADFESLDGKPVKLLFLIAAPDTKENIHLEVLSRLSTLLMDENFRKKLINAKTKEEFIEIINEAEKEKIEDEEQVKEALREEMLKLIDLENNELNLETTPSVILVVGVNGVGKTTSIGKIANKLVKEGKKVVIAAADTFRAAAVEQLEIWSNRVGCEIVKKDEGADPASVVFDAIRIAKDKNADVLICDTAGRLHNKKYLMDELGKINKIINKELPEAKKETLLVLDGTTGQNAIMQVKAFKETVDITGLILTKLDGTAKGGVVIGIVAENKIPVKFIGVGEQIDDMEKFNAKDFINAII